MAETGKGVTAGKLAINVQKRLTRAQEKVMQKLGKADETRDAAFEEMVGNFNKQMAEGSKLHKDLKAYLAAVKAMHDASRRLQDCLADMYEPDWFGKEEMDTQAEEMIEKEMDNNLEDTDTLWLDYHQNMTDKSLNHMDTYLAQFPEIKARIAKRDRKMVDFDSARHHFASLQKGKKKDEAKIAKAEEDLGRAQKIFEELNVELQDELPALWDNRVGVYVNTFQSLAGHQEKFHREMSKLSQNLNDIMTKLDEQQELKKGAAAKAGDGAKSEDVNHSESAAAPPQRPGPLPSRPPPQRTPSPDQRDQDEDPRTQQQEPQYGDDPYPEEAPGGRGYAGSPVHSCAQPGWDAAETDVGQESWRDGGGCEPSWDQDGAQTAVTNGSHGDVPPGFLYKVRAVHDYAATDSDELELKTGDLVLALAFENPDEQDDGWLMGVKEADWLQSRDVSAKGVFPENFTQKI